MSSSSSFPNVKESQKVFINFRGDLRNSFVEKLDGALKTSGIKAFIDSDMPVGDDLSRIFREIETSTVALVILSSRYTESRWCMKELELIMECVKREDLWVIPIFYNLETRTVKDLDGDFGVKLWDLWRKEGRDDKILKWDATLQSVLGRKVMESGNSSDDFAFMNEIISQVYIALDLDLSFKRERNLTSRERRGEDPKPEERSNRSSKSVKPGGQSLKYLEDKLDFECNDNQTRVVGIVGMPGIGKTYLAEKLFIKLKRKINHCVFIKFESGKSKEQGQEWIQKKILERLPNEGVKCADKTNPLEFWKNNHLALTKIGVVLDNVIDKEQVNIFVNREWIKKGSRIIITTRSKSLIEEFDFDLFEVPGLNERDSLELFRAQICRDDLEGSFMEMSRKFVDFSGGNPFAIKAFGDELKVKEKDEWEERLGTLAHISNVEVRKLLREFYDNDLNEKQRNAFLDIVCFFISRDEEYVSTLLDSFDNESGTEIKDLADKFLIRISNGRVEMQHLLFTMGKEFIDTTQGESWLFHSTNALEKGNAGTRGIVIDMSEMEERPLPNKAFFSMSSLRYLKVYSSNDPGGNSEGDCKLNLPDGLEFREDNIVRYIYWMKFPGEELPSNLRKITDLRLPYSNIIDFRLPYSNIGTNNKLATNLKWVDLSHSSQLRSLSGLHNAPNLLRLNLEACTSLEELPEEMKDLKSLIFLNLRECTSLSSLPNINMESLKVLILSGCLKLQMFQVISEKLETLHLDGTAISELPSTITTLKKLTLLNLKDCRNLVTLPDCLGKLMSLQELKLSRCSSLSNFPDVKENMVNLRVLLLDGTSIQEMPTSINLPFLSFLQRLCLSRNDEILTLQFNTSHLKWLELKHCKNLVSLQLPLNLQCLDAHGCTSLKTVSIAQDLPLRTENIHSTYIFTNCNKLEQASKKAIVSYVQKKSQLVSDDRYNRDFVFNSLIGTCFPGCQVPMWFDHQGVGSILKLKLPRDWNGGRLNGVALSVVVSFNEYKDQTTSLQVKCCCEFSDKNLRRVSFIVGGWSEQGNDKPHKIESDHVFIGYTTWFNTNKREEEEHETGYVPTEVILRFEVTNGTNEVAECEVVKCGFSLVYESDKTESVSWAASFDTPPTSEDSILDETTSDVASEHDPSESNGHLNGN